MHRRSRIAAFAAAALFALVAVSQTVLAAPKDNAAKKLDKEAMETDFLNANFDAAEKKLKDAVKTCGASDCTPKIKATVLIHLGIIQVNLQKGSDAEGSFVEGLKIDKEVAPEQDYVSPEVEKIFKEAKKKAGSGGTSAPPPKETGTGETPETPPGELEHEHVTEQMVDTPVPLFVGIPEGMKVSKVIVMYRPFGAEEWKKLDLKKMGGGYGGEIPCKEVTTTGDLKYYIKAVDSGGDPVAEVGSKGKPIITKIKNQLEGEAPHLPDKAPPAKCQSAGTCPPDFPGCKETQQCGTGGWGASCGRDKDCQCGYHCKKEDGKDEGTCEEGAATGDGEPADGAKPKKNWVSLVLSPDIAMMSGSSVCSLDSQNKGEYICYRSDDSQYHGVPASGDNIQGGFALATFRIMAGYERLFGKNITIGAKVGWAFLGSPSGFLPFHGELRGSYYFGANPFARAGLRPFVFLNVGVAAVDSKVKLKVIDDPSCGGVGAPVGPVCRYTTDSGDQDNPTQEQQTLTAWHRTGRQFAGLGGGLQYAIKPGHALGVSLKFMAMFPVFAPVISPELGYSIGF